MIGVRLSLFVASAMFISDGAREISVSDLECAYQGDENEKGYCVYVQNALRSYNVIIKFLDKLKRFGADFGDARSRIVEANGYLMKVLVQTSREVVHDLLKKALHAECGALVRAKIDCHKGEVVTEKQVDCALVYAMIGSTIQGLVDAVVDLEANASKKAELRKIQDDFYEQFPNASPNDAHTLGQSILNATKQRS